MTLDGLELRPARMFNHLNRRVLMGDDDTLTVLDEETKLELCNNCDGTGLTLEAAGLGHVTCADCDGTGKVSADIEQYPKKGTPEAALIIAMSCDNFSVLGVYRALFPWPAYLGGVKW